jgi:multisubunit Na+/H+ antiporter MnhG subunit
MVFLFITAPVTAHLLAKAALHRHGNPQAKRQEKRP